MTNYGYIYSEGDKVGFADGNGTISLWWEYIIDVGNTLIIEPSVTVYWDKMFGRFVVGGALRVVGTETNRITFTANLSDLSHVTWAGIIFEPFCDDENSIIKYCNIEYASVGIFCRNSSPSISNNIIRYCSFEGIRCEDNSNPFIANNTISANDMGIGAYDSNPVIKDNIIKMSRHYAIPLDNSNAMITGNAILNFRREAISCLGNSNPIINYNTIKNDDYWGYDEDYYFIYNDNKSIIINAEYNYWGTIDEDEIAVKMGGKVDYDPWLDEDGDIYYSTKTTDDEKFKISFELGLFIIIIIIAIVAVIVWWRRKKRRKSK